jgi:hypothetical protein
VLCWIWQRFALCLGEHLELVAHALTGEVNGLQFECAPVERFLAWMDKDVVDSTDEIPAVGFLASATGVV